MTKLKLKSWSARVREVREFQSPVHGAQTALSWVNSKMKKNCQTLNILLFIFNILQLRHLSNGENSVYRCGLVIGLVRASRQIIIVRQGILMLLV